MSEAEALPRTRRTPAAGVEARADPPPPNGAGAERVGGADERPILVRGGVRAVAPVSIDDDDDDGADAAVPRPHPPPPPRRDAAFFSGGVTGYDTI